MQSPKIIAPQSVQDDDGATRREVVEASLTYQILVAAIAIIGSFIYLALEYHSSR